ncbi:MAG TPA: HEAT repeat domain-containing protein, partial [Thermoanaerobaculia bacterium]|nr:HEAT repeat domain-containing protein [Thermoanaerobaculia bacterium]
MRSLRTAGLLLLVPLLACSAAAPAAAPGGGDLVLDVPLAEERALLLLMVDRQLFEPMMVDRLVISPEPRLRQELATALGRIGDPRGRTWLAQLLADSAVEVRRAAAFALGELDYGGDPAAGDEISVERREAARGLLVAVADPDRETGLLAVEALGKVGVSVVDVLGALTRSELAEDERWARLLPPLFRFDEPATVPVAEGALGRVPDPELRRRAVYALARSPRPESLPRLRELVGDDDPRVRAWAARALGIVGDTSDLERLAALLGGDASSGRDGVEAGAPGDSVTDVAADAAPAIQALRAGAALAAVAASGEGGTVVVPPAVEDAWRQHLLRLVSDPRPHVRLEALDTAGVWLGGAGDGQGAVGSWREGGAPGRTGSGHGPAAELADRLAARAADGQAAADERAAALLA